MRIFVAIDVPQDVRLALGDLIAKLEKTSRGARWVRPEGMHITLKFIGEAADDSVEKVKASLAGIHSPSPVQLNFRGTGFFPNDRHPRIFWAGMEASPNLAAIASEMERRLVPLGIAAESRAFRPHLTLARFKSEDGLAQLRSNLDRVGQLEFGSSRESEFHLYRSVLKRDGAEYTRLATFEFVKASA
ncbi:MAG: RNA 2',3'-cyclic phosphodiesterase [Candidatus Acidiferrales bacterium]